MADRPWQWGYGIVGLWQVLLVVCFSLTHNWWQTTHPSQDTPGTACRASSGATLRLPVVWLSIAVFFIYTGLEAAAGTWAFSLFYEARAISMHAAGRWVSVYWGSLMVGRLLSGIAVNWVPIPLLLRYCIIGIAGGALLIWVNLTDLLSCLGLALIGLACAPIFPSLIATTPGRLGKAHTANGVGLQVAAAVLGAALVPALVGTLAYRLGLEIVGPSLFTAALVLLGVYEALRLISSKTHQTRLTS
jgi:fucose permease